MRTSFWKRLLSSVVLVVAAAAGSRAQVQDLAHNRTAPERTAILDALRAVVRKDVGVPVSFVVEALKKDGNWVFFRGKTRNAAGGPIDWAAVPAYRDAVKEGLFDGDGTAALLRRHRRTWVVAAYVIGPTDVAWACWWKEYKAPRRIFDYAEACP